MQLVNFDQFLLDFDSLKEKLRGMSIESLFAWHSLLSENSDFHPKVLQITNFLGFEIGVREGWWEDFDVLAPIPFPQTFSLKELSLAEGSHITTAHVVVKLGIFPSVGQARKNGFNDPVKSGDVFTFTKKKIRVRIV